METIVRIAARGEGVTESGRHAALTAPGDLIDDRGSVEAGPHRVDPPCRHFPVCGGCQLQHIDDESYASFLIDRVRGALIAQGLNVPDIVAPHLSPPCSRRRASLTAERKGRSIRIGFNEAASHRIVDLTECHILHPALWQIVAPLRKLLVAILRDKGRAKLQMTLADQGLDLLLDGPEIGGLEAEEALVRFAAQNKVARIAVDEGYGHSVRWEPTPVTIALGGTPVPLPTGAFLQATADGEAALVNAVREIFGPAPFADLFSGLGTFALQLDGPGLAVEGSRDAALALAAASQKRAHPLTVEHRDLFRRPLSASELRRFACVVLDPPRTGAKEQAAELARSSVASIGYVSCNPSTFARDVKTLLSGGYKLDWVKPVGQFRWSTHVELVARLSR